MKTFYRPEMNVAGNNSFSPSAGKPKAFIEYLEKNKHSLELITDFDPITVEDFSRAHEKEFVLGILELRRNNGFGSRNAEVAKSLPYTSGSFYAAAEYALKHRQNTFSPTSGFHHAHYSSCGGFCTFNGLVVSAMKIFFNGLASKIGIVDLDMHYGDGTENIISELNLRDKVVHYTFGAQRVSSHNAEAWLNSLEESLKKFSECEVVFYQAGGDPHINDPLGGVLTTEQMKKRDEIVFDFFAKLGVPVVWNLAGGYQSPLEKVLELHLNTYKAALSK